MELRALLSEAAASGDYEAVTRLTLWAKQLASLPTSGIPVPPIVGDVTSNEPAAKRLTRQGAVQAAGRKREARRSGKRSARPDYPKFFRQGDNLVKIGWSRRSKKEYQHKAPRRVLLLVAGAIGKVGAQGRVFAAEDFLPLTDPQDGLEIPGYQAYVCLAWLRKAGLVDRRGRKEYAVGNPGALESSVEAQWQLVPRS